MHQIANTFITFMNVMKFLYIHKLFMTKRSVSVRLCGRVWLVNSLICLQFTKENLVLLFSVYLFFFGFYIFVFVSSFRFPYVDNDQPKCDVGKSIKHNIIFNICCIFFCCLAHFHQVSRLKVYQSFVLNIIHQRIGQTETEKSFLFVFEKQGQKEKGKKIENKWNVFIFDMKCSLDFFFHHMFGRKSLFNLNDRKQQDNKNKSVFVIDDGYIAMDRPIDIRRSHRFASNRLLYCIIACISAER